MPVCFQLRPKGSTTPQSFIEIDEAMCLALGQPVDAEKYLWGWYDSIGLRLACGQSFQTMIDRWEQDKEGADEAFRAFADRQISMAKWLDANYSSDSWREVGRG